MLEVKLKSKNLVNEFAKATESKDLKALADLLDDEGVFEIHNPQNETEETDKTMFLLWYMSKLNTMEITETKKDQCLDCHLGKPVLLFNKGRFPIKLNRYWSRVRTGVMLGIENEKINLIRFCYVFLRTENNYFEKYASENTSCLTAQGMDYIDAYNAVQQMDPDEIVFDGLSEEDLEE